MMVYTSFLDEKGKRILLKMIDKPNATEENSGRVYKTKAQLEQTFKKVDSKKANHV